MTNLPLWGAIATPRCLSVLLGTSLSTEMDEMENGLKSERTVFIIDDDAGVRRVLSDLIESVGLRTKTFADTTEFQQIGDPTEVSCLILDVRLPGLSGLDFQSELARANIHIPIIFITGHGDIPMTAKAMKHGAVEFLTKPIREQDLLDAIRVALDRDASRRKQEDQSADLRARFDALTEREKGVIAGVLAGRMNKQIAAALNVSEVTVKAHRHNAMKKLGAKSIPDLVRMAEFFGVKHRKSAAAHEETRDRLPGL
jgi:FixJ family two-component response regulator